MEKGNYLHPLEIKKAASPDKLIVKKFDVLEKSSITQGNGGIICLCEQVDPIDERNFIWLIIKNPSHKIVFIRTFFLTYDTQTIYCCFCSLVFRYKKKANTQLQF